MSDKKMSEETKLPPLIEKLANAISEKKLTVKFGLEQQGHIPTIERILNELGSNEYAWQTIGKEIGWCHKTAAYWYIDYLRNHQQSKHP